MSDADVMEAIDQQVHDALVSGLAIGMSIGLRLGLLVSTIVVMGA